jgi:hypothetical protein
LDSRKSTYIQQGEDDAFEERARFVQGAFQCLVVVNVKLLILRDVLSDGVKEYNAEEELGLWGFHA